jgi:hypothetical protein
MIPTAMLSADVLKASERIVEAGMMEHNEWKGTQKEKEANKSKPE